MLPATASQCLEDESGTAHRAILPPTLTLTLALALALGRIDVNAEVTRRRQIFRGLLQLVDGGNVVGDEDAEARVCAPCTSTSASLCWDWNWDWA